MRAADLLLMSLRNLRRQRLRTALTVFAVVIGATSVTVMLALVTGARTFFVSQFTSNGQLQQIAVSTATDLDYDKARYGGGSSDSGIRLDDALLQRIRGLDHVRAATAVMNVWCFDALLAEGHKLAIANIQAYEPNGVIRHDVLAGRDLAAGDAVGLITLSPGYADKLGYHGHYADLVGRTVTLRTFEGFSGQGATLPAPPVVKVRSDGSWDGGKPDKEKPTGRTDVPATVVGVVSSDSDPSIYLTLPWARGLMQERHWELREDPHAKGAKGTPGSDGEGKGSQGKDSEGKGGHGGKGSDGQGGKDAWQPLPPRPVLVTFNELSEKGYQAIIVAADATTSVAPVAAAIRKLGVGAATAEDYLKQQQGIFVVLGAILGAIGGIALLVAAVGVINTMVMAILERTREIGVLRASGATRATIRRMFTLEATLIGFWGGMIGLGVGYGLILAANPILNQQFRSNGIQAADVIGLPLWLITGVLAATSLTGLLAGLYPAARAARLNPVQALGHE